MNRLGYVVGSNRILKGSRLEVIDQAGHCPNDEQPEVFNQLAIEFL